MKICYFGIYDPMYSRNNILLQGLRLNGIEIVECRANWNDPHRYRKLWKSLRSLKNDYDYIYAAYPSPVPTLLAKIASRKPVICDAFYSMYDSVVNDRKKFSRWSPKSIKLLALDWLSVLVADLIVTDTEAHKEYWDNWFGIRKDKIHTVYLGINDKLFFPQPESKSGSILVHFHGTYIPLQGALKIIEAANLLRDQTDIRFRMIGDGREFKPGKALVEKYGLKNIEFLGMVTLTDLNKYMSQADILLGIFGDTAKAKRVIPNKVYEGAAARKSLITMDTPAIREIFTEKELVLVDGSPKSIADAIIMLREDAGLREKYAGNGYAKVQQLTPVRIGKMLFDAIKNNV